ncbi:serine/threonine protein kinase, partial [Myxococcota bacterium]|nr:serine/threonine protein kinase [Myxococcota bacterium]
MTSLLVSSDPRAPGQYHLGGKIGAIGLVELLAGQRVYPPERAGPVLVKHAPRTHPSFAGIRERLVDEVQGHAVYVHPNLTALTDVVEDERGLFVVFEYPFGADLAAINGVLRPRAQPLPFELAAYVARELSRGAQHLHDARGPRGEPQPISLRDVTPTQVLVTARGEVKLANRGLASILAELRRLPAPEQVAYYAPERIAGEPFGVRTDLFAIGVMLFELLVGRPCFSGATQEAVLTQIVSSAVPASLLPTVGVPAPLAAIVERATAFVPERRYASAAEMARDLDAWLA